MTCTKHNLRMIRLVLRGRIHGPEHAALLADVRRCTRCDTPLWAERPRPAYPVAVPRVRTEQTVREMQDAMR